MTWPLAELTCRELVARHALAPVSIAQRFQDHAGAWHGSPLAWRTQIFHGAGALARLKLATIESEGNVVSSLTVVGMPTPGAARPIFGADLVAFRGRLTLFALDLAPPAGTLPPEIDAHLAAIRHEVATAALARPAATASGGPFSPFAVVVTPRRIELPVRAAYEAYLAAFARCLEGPLASPIDAEAERAFRRNFCQGLSRHMKQMPVLAQMFGAKWTQAYFDEVFFPDDDVG